MGSSQYVSDQEFHLKYVSIVGAVVKQIVDPFIWILLDVKYFYYELYIYFIMIH